MFILSSLGSQHESFDLIDRIYSFFSRKIFLLKMVCLTTCAFAVAFIVAAIYISFTSPNTAKQFEDSLDDGQKVIYKHIVQMRLKIYIIASIVGAILGLLYILFMRKKQSNIGLVCGAVIIFFVTQILVYMIYPKDKYMLDYIDSNDQARAWIKNYNEMMKNYLIGFVLGLVGYIILCFAFLK